MRKVLVLNQYALPRSEAGGTRHVDLFGRLTDWEPVIVASSRNHATQQVFETDDPRFVLLSVPAYAGNGVGRVVGWLLYLLQAIAVGLRTRSISVVYASSPHLLSGLAGWIIATLRRKPFVLEIRDLWPESIVDAGALRRDSMLHRMLTGLEGWLYRRARRIVVVTDGWADHFAALGVSTDKLVVIPNGTELADFEVTASREALRHRYGFSEPTAIFAGTHGFKDGLDEILDAAARLPGVRFVLMGAGAAKSDAEARARRERLANVDFRDPVPKSELPSVLAACDVGIHAVSPLAVFQLGMSPNKLFDYLAAGLPIVSNAGRGVADLLGTDECGPVGDAGSLAEGLRETLALGPEARLAMGARGRAMLRDRFSRQLAAGRLEAALASVGGARRPAPRIAHVTTAHPANDNRILRKECAALIDAGFEVHLLARPHDDRLDVAVRHHTLPVRSTRARRMLVAPLDAWRCLRRIDPDLVHVHDPELIPMAVTWRLLHRTPVVYDAHEDLPRQVAGKSYVPRLLRPSLAVLARVLETVAARRLDHVVAATPSISHNFDPDRVTVVQNFPWRSTAAPPPVTVDPDNRTAVYVGGIDAGRGVSEMVEATAAVRSGCALVLAGPEPSDHVRAILRSAPHVLYAGQLDGAEVPDLLRRSAVGMAVLRPLPNYVSSQATKIFEYMAVGLPCVVSDFEWWRTLLAPHGCAMFVDPRDPAAIAEALQQLLDDPGLRAEMGARGRRAVRERFNFDREAAALVAMTRDLTSSSGARRTRARRPASGPGRAATPRSPAPGRRSTTSRGST